MERKKILFQGDSITDAGRDYNGDYHMGFGYATLVGAALNCERPNEFVCQNRGISGNRVIDLLARVKADMINLKPDYMSILIGVNDVWHELGGNCNGVSAERFEVYYNLLIEQLQEALPDLKLMILEPFLTEGTGTSFDPAYWSEFRSEVDKRAAVARRVAEKHGLIFVPLQERFDEVIKIAPAEHWTHDGVHPTAAGHEIIKRAWLEAFPG